MTYTEQKLTESADTLRIRYTGMTSHDRRDQDHALDRAVARDSPLTPLLDFSPRHNPLIPNLEFNSTRNNFNPHLDFCSIHFNTRIQALRSLRHNSGAPRLCLFRQLLNRVNIFTFSVATLTGIAVNAAVVHDRSQIGRVEIAAKDSNREI